MELAAVKLMKRRLGPFLAEPYEQEAAGRYDKLAKALSGVGAAVTAFADLKKSRAASVAGGALILAGAACGAGRSSRLVSSRRATRSTR